MGGFDFGSLLGDSDEDESNPLSKVLKGLFSNGGGGLGSETSPQESSLPDSFSSFTSTLNQPSGSVVSGGKEDLYHRYSQLLEQKPESEGVLSEYISRMPRHENYKPTGGTKLQAAGMGIAQALNSGDTNSGIAKAQEWRNKPFERQNAEYKQEGSFIDDQMRSADSARNRSLQGMLAQIKQQEVETNNRYKNEAMKTLREQQKIDSDRRKEKYDLDREEKRKDREAKNEDRDFDRKDRNQRHEESLNLRRELKSFGGEDKLDPFEKVGLEKYKRSKTGDELLASLGFGAPEETSYPKALINPITGLPYTAAEVASLGKKDIPSPSLAQRIKGRY